MKLTESRKGWAVEWNGALVGRYMGETNPEDVLCYTPLVFRTRKIAREWSEKRFGYIRDREDLQRPPHCWTMPKIVRVYVTVERIRYA